MEWISSFFTKIVKQLFFELFTAFYFATILLWQALICLKESLFVLVDIMFGVLIIFIRIKWASLESR